MKAAIMMSSLLAVLLVGATGCKVATDAIEQRVDQPPELGIEHECQSREGPVSTARSVTTSPGLASRSRSTWRRCAIRLHGISDT